MQLVVMPEYAYKKGSRKVLEMLFNLQEFFLFAINAKMQQIFLSNGM